MALKREDVVQMGVTVRTGSQPIPYGQDDALNYFSLAMDFIKVFRTQTEPQVVYLGKDVGTQLRSCSTAEMEVEEEEEASEDDGMMSFSSESFDEDLSRLKEETEAAAAAEIEELVLSDPLSEPQAGQG